MEDDLDRQFREQLQAGTRELIRALQSYVRLQGIVDRAHISRSQLYKLTHGQAIISLPMLARLMRAFPEYREMFSVFLTRYVYNRVLNGTGETDE